MAQQFVPNAPTYYPNGAEITHLGVVYRRIGSKWVPIRREDRTC